MRNCMVTMVTTTFILSFIFVFTVNYIVMARSLYRRWRLGGTKPLTHEVSSFSHQREPVKPNIVILACYAAALGWPLIGINYMITSAARFIITTAQPPTAEEERQHKLADERKKQEAAIAMKKAENDLADATAEMLNATKGYSLRRATGSTNSITVSSSTSSDALSRILSRFFDCTGR